MPKPVLSDSLFNADDVATAILNKANLQITNSNLGVTELTNLLTPSSGYTLDYQCAYSFNGFIFVAGQGNTASVSHGDVLATIHTDYTPVKDTVAPTISHSGDNAMYLLFNTTSNLVIYYPDNPGHSNFNYCFNGFYRYA